MDLLLKCVVGFGGWVEWLSWIVGLDCTVGCLVWVVGFVHWVVRLGWVIILNGSFG